MARALKFETGPYECPVLDTLVTASLATDPDHVPEKPTGIVLDGSEIDIDPEITQALSATIRMCALLKKGGDKVDCSVFGVILTGGTYEPSGDRQVYERTHKSISLGEVKTIEELERFTSVMKPLVVGVPHPYDHNGIWPRHMAVRISESEDLYAQKFGDGPISIGNLRQAADYYSSSLMGTVVILSFDAWPGHSILEYNSGSNIEPAYVYEA